MSGRIGVILANLGTPDAPTYSAVRRFLRDFLSDRRVIQLSRWIWLPILYLFVLTLRPFRSAKAYRKIWTPAGSPLLIHGRAQESGVGRELNQRLDDQIEVALGMAYGTPSLESAAAQLKAAGCKRVLCLPLYPQYSGTTTGSIIDQLNGLVAAEDLNIIRSYEGHPLYIKALLNSIDEAFKARRPQALVLSFHSIPLHYLNENEPYRDQCERTARLLREAIGLPANAIHLAYQSRFGPTRWLGPSTLEILAKLAGQGVKTVDVICPGFSSDCLETLEEIGIAAREEFLELGGEELRLIPCLNDREDHIQALSVVISEELLRWQESRGL